MGFGDLAPGNRGAASAFGERAAGDCVAVLLPLGVSLLRNAHAGLSRTICDGDRQTLCDGDRQPFCEGDWQRSRSRDVLELELVREAGRHSPVASVRHANSSSKRRSISAVARGKRSLYSALVCANSFAGSTNFSGLGGILYNNF